MAKYRTLAFPPVTKWQNIAHWQFFPRKNVKNVVFLQFFCEKSGKTSCIAILSAKNEKMPEK
jgi:hypothetical protein